MVRIPLLARLAVPGLLLSAGCQPGPAQLSDEERRAVEAEIEAVQEAMTEVFRDADLVRGLAYFQDHPDLRFAFNAGSWSSVAALEEEFRPLFDQLDRQEIRVDERRIAVLSRNAAHVFERGEFTQHWADGTVSPAVPFVITFLWVRTEDGWRVLDGHESTP